MGRWDTWDSGTVERIELSVVIQEIKSPAPSKCGTGLDCLNKRSRLTAVHYL